MTHDDFHTLITSFKHQGQRQDGTSDQISDLVVFSDRLGFTSGSNEILGNKAERSAAPRNEMPATLGAILEGIEQQVVSSDEPLVQLQYLHHLANRLGLYDAADYLRLLITAQSKGGLK
jgi:hypothetical protein